MRLKKIIFFVLILAFSKVRAETDREACEAIKDPSFNSPAIPFKDVTNALNDNQKMLELLEFTLNNSTSPPKNADSNVDNLCDKYSKLNPFMAWGDDEKLKLVKKYKDALKSACGMDFKKFTKNVKQSFSKVYDFHKELNTLLVLLKGIYETNFNAFQKFEQECNNKFSEPANENKAIQ